MTQIFECEPNMSQASKDILMKLRKMIPPLLNTFHKGQMGRVAVMGGCEDYTGAPFFSAIASARTGADLNHVICEPSAAQIIKTYSPNLMVHPLMCQSRHARHETVSSIAKPIIEMLPRLHVLVIGPGLGRDKLMLDTCAYVIETVKLLRMPLVLDADGLLIAQNRSDLIQGYKDCVLTPNVHEFGRLCQSKGISPFELDNSECVARLSRAFGGVTIIQKGPSDYISDGNRTLINDIPGGLKRSGGQGDTLTGCVATFLCWRRAYMDKVWENERDLDDAELLALAAFGGSALTRECSRLAYLKHGRSLQASDLTQEIKNAFLNLFGTCAS